MIPSSLRRVGRGATILVLAGGLFLSSCSNPEEADDSGEGSGGQSGPAPSALGGSGSGDPESSEKKSGPRAGKPAAPGMTTTASGLQYEVLNEGDGATPGPTDTVTVHYHGTLQDGTVFDSSVQRNQPATFPVNGVIQGWVEGLQLMKVGSKFKFVIPPNLAYGSRGAGGVIGPNETLVFEVELLSID